MTSRFRSGAEAAQVAFEATHLPDMQKEALCRELLAEFGVTNVTANVAKGELIHSCCLPFGLHPGGDTHPSASLSWKKLAFNCFTCGGGGLLWFVGVMRGESATESRVWLAKQTGAGGTQDLDALLSFFDALYGQRDDTRQPLPKLSPKILEPWRLIHPYLTEIRRIPESTIIHFNVGYNPKEERIVIPHYWRNVLVGWQTRRLLDDGSPKYRSSADFPREQTIYNYRPKQRRVVVVESPMSVLSKHHLDVPIEATFGASVTARQTYLLGAHDEIILFMDNDEAGWKATRQLGRDLRQYSRVLVANNPYAADAADLDDETYRAAIDTAVPYPLWSRPSRLKAWDEHVPASLRAGE